MTRTDNFVGYLPISKHINRTPERDCSPEVLAGAFAVLEGRWKLMILHHLFGEEGLSAPARRFSELEKAIPLVSQKMLIQQLRCLEQDGIVQRTIYPQVPPKVDYRLTELGEALRPTLRALLDWANFRKQHGSDKSSQTRISEALTRTDRIEECIGLFSPCNNNSEDGLRQANISRIDRRDHQECSSSAAPSRPSPASERCLGAQAENGR